MKKILKFLFFSTLAIAIGFFDFRLFQNYSNFDSANYPSVQVTVLSVREERIPHDDGKGYDTSYTSVMRYDYNGKPHTYEENGKRTEGSTFFVNVDPDTGNIREKPSIMVIILVGILDILLLISAIGSLSANGSASEWDILGAIFDLFLG